MRIDNDWKQNAAVLGFLGILVLLVFASKNPTKKS